MPALSKEALLALKPKVEAVAVPEAGDGAEIYIAELDALSVFEFTSTFREFAKKGAEAELDSRQVDTINTLLERSIVDAEGNRLFEPGEFAQVRLSFAVRQRLFDKALELSGMKADQAEEERKNPEPTRTSASLVA